MFLKGGLVHYYSTFIAGLMFFVSSAAFGDVCDGRWEVFSSEPYAERAFPDTNVKYWRLHFATEPGQRVALNIKGLAPPARYFALGVFNQEDGNYIDGIYDRQMLFGTDELARGADQFDVWLAPENSPAYLDASHTLKMGGDQIRLRTLWFRSYLPEHAGHALPEVTAYDADTLSPIECPKRVKLSGLLLIGRAAENLPPKGKGGDIDFYYPPAASLYANPDTSYLGARLASSEVAVLRFVPPRASECIDCEGSDVRYWSICMGGIISTTSQCLSDRDAVVAADGKVTLVFGPEAIRQDVEQSGYNFMPWDDHLIRVLLYRHLLVRDDFGGRFSLMPRLPRPRDRVNLDLEPYKAQASLGEFAPVGKQCKLSEDFLETLCGM